MSHKRYEASRITEKIAYHRKTAWTLLISGFVFAFLAVYVLRNAGPGLMFDSQNGLALGGYILIPVWIAAGMLLSNSLNHFYKLNKWKRRRADMYGQPSIQQP